MTIPPGGNEAELEISGKRVRLTNLEKPFWPELGITRRDLLGYYVEISRFLLPHLADRAMAMKRYPNGAHGEFFFMKRTPSPHPEWLRTCSVTHASGNVIAFPVIDDLASLLWVVNPGCIDLNQWYAKCDDVNRPDYLHFDLDPVVSEDGKSTGWKKVLETACAVHEALEALKTSSYPKTTESRGIHIYVPIVRRPLQKQVRAFAKEFAKTLETRPSKADHRRIPRGEAPCRTCAGRLPPERLGPNHGVRLFGAAAAAGHLFHASDVG